MPTALPTGTKILLTCEHTRIVKFNDSHNSTARFWCDSCDRTRGFVAVLTAVSAEAARNALRTLVQAIPEELQGEDTLDASDLLLVFIEESGQ